MTNIRSAGDLTELRESMAAVGWLKHLPALFDEQGETITGHRRLQVAKELGLEPVTMTVKLTADERKQYEIFSNVGGKPFSAAERKKIAMSLYGGEWTMAKIAKALGVSQRTISEDLRGLEATSKLNRPKGGRPKSSKPKPSRRQIKADELKAEVIAEHNEGKPSKEIASKHGVAQRHVDMILQKDKIKRDAIAEYEPTIKREDLSLTAQKKFDIAVRLYQSGIDERIRKEVVRRLGELWKDVWFPDYQKKIDDAEAVIKARRGAMPRSKYRMILAALHPDSRKGLSDKRLADAFDEFAKHELVLVKEAELSTNTLKPLPSTLEELQAARDVVRQRNRERSMKAKSGAVVERRARA